MYYKTGNHYLVSFQIVDDDGEEQWLTAERRIKAMHPTSVQVSQCLKLLFGVSAFKIQNHFSS